MSVLENSFFYQQILREGERRGIMSGIELGLELKFGSDGLQLMPEISQISNLERLKAIQQAIKTVNSVDELKQII